jgi:hypothetical protein
MTAFFHPSGSGPGGTSVASLSVADRALVSKSNAATISDAGASATNVYSSSKIDSLLTLVEANITFKQACICRTLVPLAACVYAPGLPGTLTASANGLLGDIGGVSGLIVDDRVLVKNQVEKRQNGVYGITDLGAAGSPWQLTRSADSDGSPTSEMRGGAALSVIGGASPFMFILTGVGEMLVTSGTLLDNDDTVPVTASSSIKLALLASNSSMWASAPLPPHTTVSTNRFWGITLEP